METNVIKRVIEWESFRISVYTKEIRVEAISNYVLKYDHKS